MPQQVFQEHLERERQPCGPRMRPIDGVEAEDGVLLLADTEAGLAAE